MRACTDQVQQASAHPESVTLSRCAQRTCSDSSIASRTGARVCAVGKRGVGDLRSIKSPAPKRRAQLIVVAINFTMSAPRCAMQAGRAQRAGNGVAAALAASCDAGLPRLLVFCGCAPAQPPSSMQVVGQQPACALHTINGVTARAEPRRNFPTASTPKRSVECRLTLGARAVSRRFMVSKQRRSTWPLPIVRLWSFLSL